MRLAALLLLGLALSLPGAPARAEERALLIFAAASLTDALNAVLAAYGATPGAGPGGAGPVRVSTAASSTLARQIERGAPADLYIAANPQWMDHLAQAGAIRVESRRDLLSNRLVLIAPGTSARDEEAPPFPAGIDLMDRLGEDGYLAMGDPDHVPAGLYAAHALRHFGLWQGLSKRLARAANVRAALALVARGEAPLGIVYQSDARAEPGVRILARFPPESHPPITYPIAVTAASGAPRAAARLADYLGGAAAARLFEAAGFTPPPPGPPS